MPHLPPELLLIILEHAYYTPRGYPNYTLLANCSLVCTSWSEPAQSLLFRKTTRLYAYAAALFLAAVASSAFRGKFMGHVVRSLEISANLPSQVDSFVQVLQACPNTYELTLTTFGHDGFDQFMLAKLKESGKGIRALNLPRGRGESLVAVQLLGIWPHVQFLRIGDGINFWSWPREDETSVFHQPRGNEIPRLSLYELQVSHVPPPHILRWLLGSSVSSLCILDLHGISNPFPENILSVHAPHLRSLRLLDFSPIVASFVSQCTHLEEFAVYNVVMNIPLAPVLSPSIKHFSFRNTKGVRFYGLLSIIDAIEVLPRLRIVTCDKNSVQFRDFETLETRCAERGVEVVISEELNWMREDPVVVGRFPRRRSVSNFKLMSG